MAGYGNRPSRGSGGTVGPASRGFSSPTINDFDGLKRRYDRTRPTNGGLGNDVSDRPRSWGSNRKQLTAGLTRKRALGVYRSQASRPLGELTADRVRAPFGRFSTVSNPAPAKAFPSQAPGRTKTAETRAREWRKEAKARNRKRN